MNILHSNGALEVTNQIYIHPSDLLPIQSYDNWVKVPVMVTSEVPTYITVSDKEGNPTQIQTGTQMVTKQATETVVEKVSRVSEAGEEIFEEVKKEVPLWEKDLVNQPITIDPNGTNYMVLQEGDTILSDEEYEKVKEKMKAPQGNNGKSDEVLVSKKTK